MWTGLQTLNSIENTIGRLYKEESELDGSLKSAAADAARLRQERVEALRELARIKLDEMQAGRLVSDLDAAERRGLQLLEDRHRRVSEATERREVAMKDVARAETERSDAAKSVEQALAAVEAIRADAEVKVQATPEWRTAKAPFDEADAVAAEAEKKATSSEEELGAKKKPYDSDPLFAYLWSRGFGTSRYATFGIVRYIDQLVGNFIGFHAARANYAMLVEIPRRLREHAAAQRAIALERKVKLSEVERRAMVQAGIEAKERDLAQARQRLAAADTALEAKRQLLRTADDDRSKLMAVGDDAAYKEALETIAAADGKDDIDTLYREARRTPTPADEIIVRKLETLDERIGKADAEVASIRGSAQDLAKRRMEVERVRDRFRDAGYDHPHTTFGNDNDLERVLRQTLGGAVQSGLLWELLRQGFGYRPPRGRPDFGAPTFPFPFPVPGGGNSGPIGGDWREPRSRGGWAPRDDGFSTGGSF